MGGGLSTETSEMLLQQTASDYTDALKQLYESNNQALYRSADITSSGQDLLQFFADIGVADEAAISNMEKAFALGIRSKNELFGEVCNNPRVADFLTLTPEQKAFITISSNTFQLSSQLAAAQQTQPQANTTNSPLRNRMLENTNKTAADMLEILKKAYDEALKIGYGANNADMSPSFGEYARPTTTDSPLLQADEEFLDMVQEELERHEVDIIWRWNTALSSPLLQFSSDLKSTWRTGVAGYFPAALVPVTNSKTMLTVMLNKAPPRNNYFSFGVSIIANISSERNAGCFGQVRGTWGLLNRRSNNQPIEIWGDGHRLDSQRHMSLREGDILTLYLDITRRSCHVLLNRAVVYVFENVCSENGPYVMGAIVCDDHVLEVIPQNATEHYFGLVEMTGEVPFSSTTSSRSNADYDNTSPLYSYHTIDPTAGHTRHTNNASHNTQQQHHHLHQNQQRSNHPVSSASASSYLQQYHQAILDHVAESFPMDELGASDAGAFTSPHEAGEEEMLKTIMDYYDAQEILQQAASNGSRFLCPPTVDEYDLSVAAGNLEDIYALQHQLVSALEVGMNAYNYIDQDEYALTPAELYESMDRAVIPVPDRFPQQQSLLGGIQESRRRQEQQEQAALRQLSMVGRQQSQSLAVAAGHATDAAVGRAMYTSQSMPQINTLASDQVATERNQIGGTNNNLRAESKDSAHASIGSDTKEANALLLKSSEVDSKAENKITSADNESTILCCICMEHNKCILLVPCRHLCLCEPCSESGMVSNCPICRQDVQHFIKVFL